MTHGSLFSGIGGFDLAAEWMGWQNVFHCEWMPFPRKILHHYWPKSKSYENICTTDFTIHRGQIDILTGGFPCQPYSSAGKRLGKEDERHLWPEMLRAIQEIEPSYVVGENVRGLTNWNGGVVFEEVCVDLENCGYEIQPVLLPACAVGAPHRRDRVWFVAYSNVRGRCWKTGFGEYDLRRSQRKKSNNNINSPNQRLEFRQNTEFATNADNIRQHECNCDNEINTSEGRFNALNDINENDGQRNASDSYYERLQGRQEINKLQEYNNKWPRNGLKFGTNGKNNNRESRSNFERFPSQSPICGGNDGVSYGLDGITFSKWRQESIKGYGNAIVPQVAYQIFKVIQYMENERIRDTIQNDPLP